MNAVVNHIAGHDQPEIRNVEDAVTGAGGMPEYTLSQSNDRVATAACICAIVPALATTRAPNRSANSPAANQWSPWPWVTKMSVRFRPLSATQSPSAMVRRPHAAAVCGTGMPDSQGSTLPNWTSSP